MDRIRHVAADPLVDGSEDGGHKLLLDLDDLVGADPTEPSGLHLHDRVLAQTEFPEVVGIGGPEHIAIFLPDVAGDHRIAR